MLIACSRGRVAAPVFFLLTSFLASGAQAHGARTDIRITLDAPKIAGLRVELHQGDIAPQLVLENRSGKLLEILDTTGQPFLRVGPKKVEADLNSPDWRASLNPRDVPAHAPVASRREPNWKMVLSEPAFGWFDPRINPDPVQIPPEIQAVGIEAPVSAWTIPARLGGEPLDIKGRFFYLPPPRGVVQAALSSTMEVAPGVRVMLAPGRPPALFLENRSKQIVSVLDAQGRTFLSIGPEGVRADTGSAAWKVAAPIRTDSKPGWRQISKARSFTWLEPRAAWQGPAPRPAQGDTQRRILNHWRVPLRIGDRQMEIAGVNEWIPSPKSDVVPERDRPWP